jgi:hypothetical protein
MSSVRLARCLALALLAPACGPSFETPSVVDSLRVLAVRADPASGAPGETSTLEMLYADGTPLESGESPRTIQVAWLGGCHNPPGRAYYGCFPTISTIAKELSAAVIDTPEGALPPGAFGIGTAFSVPLPDDILSSAPSYPGDTVHFGVSYAFFAACAGELRPRPEWTDRVPLACVDPASGRELDADDFVQGFATLPTYEGARNENPVLTGVRFGSLDVLDAACAIDTDCDGIGGAEPGKLACTATGKCALVVRRCASDEDDCSEILVDPEIETDSAQALPGDQGKEILWANFYATDGDFETPTQLVNDRATGWVEDHGSYFHAPDEAGEIEVFVTVHDERGGTAWSSFPVVVRP